MSIRNRTQNTVWEVPQRRSKFFWKTLHLFHKQNLFCKISCIQYVFTPSLFFSIGLFIGDIGWRRTGMCPYESCKRSLAPTGTVFGQLLHGCKNPSPRIPLEQGDTEWRVKAVKGVNPKWYSVIRNRILSFEQPYRPIILPESFY